LRSLTEAESIRIDDGDNMVDALLTNTNVTGGDSPGSLFTEPPDVESVRVLQFVVGEAQDREITATADEVIFTSRSDPLKTVAFTPNRWAHLMAMKGRVDDEVKELNRQTRKVRFREPLGDGYYVSVTGKVMCVDFRKYYVPYGLTPCSIRPTKRGIALRIDEWAQLLNEVVPAVNIAFPDLCQPTPCTIGHTSQREWLACSSCFPFDEVLGMP